MLEGTLTGLPLCVKLLSPITYATPAGGRSPKPPRSLYAPSGPVCPQTICPRRGRAVHRGGRWTRPDVIHGAGYVDRPAPSARDDCHLHRQRWRQRPRKRAWPGIRYDVTLYAEFVEKEVLPLVEKRSNLRLTMDLEWRATMGGSSGGSCALIMAWYHPELYPRYLHQPAVAADPPDSTRRMGTP